MEDKKLEAVISLSRLRNFNTSEIQEPHMEEDLLVIEKALTRLEKLEKAIQIINDKNVNISLLHCCDVVQDYNFEEHHRYGNYAIHYELTEDEFSFVKEHLSNYKRNGVNLI